MRPHENDGYGGSLDQNFDALFGPSLLIRLRTVHPHGNDDYSGPSDHNQNAV